MSDYKFSDYCDAMTNGEITLVCHVGNGNTFKIPTECWNIIEKYLGKYSIDEICDAMADDEDRTYMRTIFDSLIEKKILVNDDENKIKCVDLVLTNRCNLRCTHCCIDSDYATMCDKLTTEDWKRIIDKIIEIQPENIVITGGEPMLRDDFFELSDYLKERNKGKLDLMTNGLFINKDNVERLVKLYDGFNISLDGYDEESCSKIRGKGVFQKVIDAVELLKQNGVPSKNIALSMVETAFTKGKTQLFDELNDRLGTLSIIREFSPLGRGEINRKILEIFESENNGQFEKETGRPVCQNCLAGRQKFSINSQGDIYPCMLLEKEAYCMGNINDIPNLKEFFGKKENRKTKGYLNLEKLMPQKREECKDCNVRAYCVRCFPDFEKYVGRDDFSELCTIQKNALKYIWEE